MGALKIKTEMPDEWWENCRITASGAGSLKDLKEIPKPEAEKTIQLTEE